MQFEYDLVVGERDCFVVLVAREVSVDNAEDVLDVLLGGGFAENVEKHASFSRVEFLDALAAAARAPAGSLIVIVSDTEETCKTSGKREPTL